MIDFKKFDWANFAQSLFFALVTFSASYPATQADFSWVSYLVALGTFALNYLFSYLNGKRGVEAVKDAVRAGIDPTAPGA